MSETNHPSVKRRLELGSAKERPPVKNPYLKTSKPASTTADAAEQAGASKVTPDTGIEKFFTSKKNEGDQKPHAARKLVSPREDGVPQGNENRGQKRKSLEFSSEDDETSSLYYHSDEETRASKLTKKKSYEPGHIHTSLDYHHRGELPLDQGTLRAYRFIRNHFLIPRDIEADPKFGAYSGSCFEVRVLLYHITLIHTSFRST